MMREYLEMCNLCENSVSLYKYLEAASYCPGVRPSQSSQFLLNLLRYQQGKILELAGAHCAGLRSWKILLFLD